MTDKNYTHKIVMFDVNSAVRTAKFESEQEANCFNSCAMLMNVKFVVDNSGTRFNMENIVQINPVEVIEK